MASAICAVDADLPDDGDTVSTDHTTHNGFPIPPHNRISLLHRLTRTRLGVVVFVTLVVGFSIVPSTVIPITFLFIVSTGLVRHGVIRKISDHIAGCWIYSVAVSN